MTGSAPALWESRAGPLFIRQENDVDETVQECCRAG